MSCSLPDSSVHGIPQQEYWSGNFSTDGQQRWGAGMGKDGSGANTSVSNGEQ